MKAPRVEESRFNLECRVVQDVKFGDWVVIFGEIVETHVDVDKLDAGTGKIDVSYPRSPPWSTVPRCESTGAWVPASASGLTPERNWLRRPKQRTTNSLEPIANAPAQFERSAGRRRPAERGRV